MTSGGRFQILAATMLMLVAAGSAGAADPDALADAGIILPFIPVVFDEPSGDDAVEDVPAAPAAAPTLEAIVDDAASAPVADADASPATAAPSRLLGAASHDDAPMPMGSTDAPADDAPVALGTGEDELPVPPPSPFRRERWMDADDGERRFYDFSFGLGMVLLIDLDDGRVAEASVHKGHVRVDKEDPVRLGVMLEAHKLFRLGDSGRFGHGPFAGLVLSQGDIVDAGVLGWMLAMRRADGHQHGSASLGLFLDPNAQMLARGYEEGSPVPNVGRIEYREEPMLGVALSVTYGF